jgi:hypothetical protein
MDRARIDIYNEAIKDLDREEIKQAYKEALKEWMDEKFAIFGKWTLTGLGFMLFGIIIHFIGRFNN